MLMYVHLHVKRPGKKKTTEVEKSKKTLKANRTVVRIYSSKTFKEREKCKQVMISGYIRRADIATSQSNSRASVVVCK